MEIGLVLGGGGARGFAHIGVMRALEERNIEPIVVAGCSMGGIVGAFVAHGRTSNEIAQAFKETRKLSLLDWGSKGGVVGGRGVEKQVEKFLPEKIEDLKLPFRATAVDIQEGRLYVFSRGPLVVALRATSAVPGFFSPVDHDGRVLVDGGLLSNVPIEEARTMTTKPILAVDVTCPPDRTLIFEDNRTFLEKLKSPIQPGKRSLFIEMLTKAYEVPAAVLNDIRIAGLRPEILIRPPLDPDLKPEDFDRMDEAVEVGYREAVSILDLHALTRSLKPEATTP
jgi:NTE family protein